MLLPHAASAQAGPFVLERDGRVISVQPYAPNILRVSMSVDREAATGAAGYGFVARSSMEGWTHEHDAEGGDVFRSARMVVRLAPGNLPKDKLPQQMPLDALNRQLRELYFGRGGHAELHNDPLLVTTPSGKKLLRMRTWTMAPESPEVAQADSGVKGYHVAAVFDSPAGEHYYGLGQQQKGWMDLRDHQIRCWHDYGAIGGEDVCVPFLVSSNGYGLDLGQPVKNDDRLGLQRSECVVVRGRTAGVVLRDCGGDQRRNLPRVPAADGRHAHAAQGRLRLHPEQGDLRDAGTDLGCSEGVSREKIAARCAGGGLPEYDEAGRTGPRPEALARSGGDES